MKYGIAIILALLARFTFAQPATRAPANDDVVVNTETDAIIQSSLKWLATKQLPSGSFTDGPHQAAITSYATLAFLAAGNVPGEGKYAKIVDSAERFLLICVRGDGFIAAPTGDSNMYDHGVATLVLAELYGQTNSPAVRAKLQRAIQLIAGCQNKEGGWRYKPSPTDADISVTVLQLVALRSAKNAGLNVSQQTIDRAVVFVKSCYDSKKGGFNYQPGANDPGFARTAAAMYSLQLCGLYDDPLIAPATKYLQDNRGHEEQWFAYGHFYAAPAFYMIGGDAWKDWYPSVASKIVASVHRDASGAYWDPVPAVPSSVWTTAVYTTILATAYHYLPLYQR
jgi:hypothetical protein